MGWVFGGFSKVESAIFRFLRLFLGMMSLGRNALFLATWKSHSDPAPSQVDPKPFFCDSRPQNRGLGSLTPTKPRPVGPGGGGGLTHYAICIYIHSHTIHVIFGVWSQHGSSFVH